MKKVLITNQVPDNHLEPLLGLAEIIKGPSGGAASFLGMIDAKICASCWLSRSKIPRTIFKHACP